MKSLRCLVLTAALASAVYAHGIPIPVAIGPMHTEGSAIEDSTGRLIPLRGAVMPGLNIANPSSAQLQTIAAINDVTFGIMRLHWNFNAVRLPVSSAIWRRDGQSYLDRVGAIVKAANGRGLIAILSDYEDAASGNPSPVGLPLADTATFWTAWAAYFRDTPLVIFDLFNEPSVNGIPGHTAGQRLPSDWQFWLHGGFGTDGKMIAG